MLGIKHKQPCSHTHEQQGHAERKHRHNIKMGLALLAHAFMPFKFWEHAFETTLYLINRLST